MYIKVRTSYIKSHVKIGLTGGIGSGKSTVARIFEVLGIPVYYADDAAKRLMNEDEELKAAIIKKSLEKKHITIVYSTGNTLRNMFLITMKN